VSDTLVVFGTAADFVDAIAVTSIGGGVVASFVAFVVVVAAAVAVMATADPRW
jgi:hypothetical protein